MHAGLVKSDVPGTIQMIQNNRASIASRSVYHAPMTTNRKNEGLPTCKCYSVSGWSSVERLSFSLSYLRRLQEAQAAANGPHQIEDRNDPDLSISPASTMPSPRQNIMSPTTSSQTSSLLDPSAPAIPDPPSRYPIAADTFHSHYSSSPPASFNAMDAPMSDNTTLNSHSPETDDSQAYSEQHNSYSVCNWSYKQHQVLQPEITIPPLSHFHRPHRLEEVASRDSISLIINLFFDFVFPLTPCIHKPSFMADLNSRREEHDPLFFALVMSTVASTLVQVPRSYVPMERSAVRRLAQVRPSDSWLRVKLLNNTIIDMSRG